MEDKNYRAGTGGRAQGSAAAEYAPEGGKGSTCKEVFNVAGQGFGYLLGAAAGVEAGLRAGAAAGAIVGLASGFATGPIAPAVGVAASVVVGLPAALVAADMVNTQTNVTAQKISNVVCGPKSFPCCRDSTHLPFD